MMRAHLSSQLSSLGDRAKSSRLVTQGLRYQPTGTREAWAAIETTEQGDAPMRRALQHELLTRTLTWARHTPYGQRQPARFADWPILTKEILRDHPRDFYTSHLWALPAETGGSSGLPLKLQRSLRSIACEQAFIDYVLQPAGLSFRTARVACLRGELVKPREETAPPYGKYRDDNWLYLSVIHLNRDTFPWFVAELERFRPEILWIYPAYGDLLANLCLEAGVKLNIPVILSSSEMLFPEAWERFPQVFGGQIVDYYGQAERVCFSYHTGPETAWFMPAYGKIELLPVASSDPRYGEAQVVGTGFWNEKMPLVRYLTGDRIWYPADYTEQDLELVTLGLKPFVRVMGREIEYLVAPNGDRVYGLCNLPKGLENIMRVQVIQHEPAEVELRILPTPGYTDKDQQRLMARARTRIPDSMHIHVRSDGHFERTPRNKTPLVIRKF
jgi:phenylacetate-CoA ligase